MKSFVLSIIGIASFTLIQNNVGSDFKNQSPAIVADFQNGVDIKYSAADSTVYRGDSVVTLYGKAMVASGEITISADKISYNKNQHEVKAWSNVKFTDHDKNVAKATDSLNYNFK